MRHEFVPDFNGDGTPDNEPEYEHDFYGVTVTETFSAEVDTTIFHEEFEGKMLADSLSDLLKRNKSLWQQAKREGITDSLRTQINDTLKKIDAFTSDGAEFEAY